MVWHHVKHGIRAPTYDLKTLKTQGKTINNNKISISYFFLQEAVITSRALCARHYKHIGKEQSCAKELIAYGDRAQSKDQGSRARAAASNIPGRQQQEWDRPSKISLPALQPTPSTALCRDRLTPAHVGLASRHRKSDSFTPLKQRRISLPYKLPWGIPRYNPSLQNLENP